MTEALSIRALSLEETRAVYRAHFSADFPDNERKPFAMIEKAWRAGRYFAFGLFGPAQALLGYAFFYRETDRRSALLDYYAIVRGQRDRGLGGRFLRLLRERLIPEAFDLILIEAENPRFTAQAEARLTQERRLAFYRRSGAEDTGLRYLLYGVHYAVLALTETAEPAALLALAAEESQRIYQGMLPPALYKAHFRPEADPPAP